MLDVHFHLASSITAFAEPSTHTMNEADNLFRKHLPGRFQVLGLSDGPSLSCHCLFAMFPLRNGRWTLAVAASASHSRKEYGHSASSD